jgi:hypothetical protein
MNKRQRFTALMIVAALTLCALLSGCGGTGAGSTAAAAASAGSAAGGAAASASASASAPDASALAEQADDQAADREAEAYNLLNGLEGTYEELWPVITQEKYDDVWLQACADVVGEDQAAETARMLKGSCAGDKIGQDAVDAYQDPESGLFDCEFTGGVDRLTFSGTTISGADEKGKQVFSHSYQYVGYQEDMGFYQFQSEDKDAGAFTYFAIFPDTPGSTYHIELRYGDDLNALSELTTGKYAYWMAAGILEDSSDGMAESAIKLFCTENLSEATE